MLLSNSYLQVLSRLRLIIYHRTLGGTEVGSTYIPMHKGGLCCGQNANFKSKSDRVASSWYVVVVIHDGRRFGSNKTGSRPADRQSRNQRFVSTNQVLIPNQIQVVNRSLRGRAKQGVSFKSKLLMSRASHQVKRWWQRREHLKNVEIHHLMLDGSLELTYHPRFHALACVDVYQATPQSVSFPNKRCRNRDVVPSRSFSKRSSASGAPCASDIDCQDGNLNEPAE